MERVGCCVVCFEKIEPQRQKEIRKKTTFFFCSVAVDCAQESNKLSIKQYLKVLNAVLLFLRRLLFPFHIEMGRCDLCVTSMRSVSQLLAPNEPAVRLSGMEVLLMLTLRRHRRIVAVLCLVFIVFCCIPL